jgi:hypothetical protein
MQKSKAYTDNELVFTAPFPLKLCENRLESKRKQGNSLWFGSATEVYVTRDSRETITFVVGKGGALVKGRLDMLTSDSTLVSMKAVTDWMSYLSMVLWYSPLALVLLFPVLYGLSFVLVGFFNHPTIIVTLELLLGIGLALVACIAVYIGWWTRSTLKVLARSVERGLTDPAPDIPEFEAAAVGADGELVPAPPVNHIAAVQELEDLLKKKRDG